MAIEFLQDIKILGSDGSTTTIEGSGQSTLNLKTTTNSKNNYIVGTTSGSLSFRPNGIEALTLDLSKNATFKGTVTATGGNISSSVSGGDAFVISTSASTTGRGFLKSIGDTGAVLFSAIYGSASTGTIFGTSLTRAAAIVTTSDTSVHPTSLLVGTFTGIPLIFGTNNAERLKIDSSGNSTFSGTITTGDNGEDNSITATFTDSSFTRIHGYGLYMSRAHSYIRPTADNNKQLYLGTPTQRWSNITFDTPTSTFAGHIIPSADATYDLGTTNSLDFRTLYVRNIDIYNQRFTMGSSGTTAVLEDHSTVGDGFQFIHLGTEILRLGNDTATSAVFAGNVKVKGTNVTVENTTNPYIYLNDTNAGAAIFQQEGNDTRIGSDSNTTVKIIQNNQDAITIDTSKNAIVEGSLKAKGGLKVQDSDGTLDHVRAMSNGTEGYLTVSNGSNWGFIARGPGNEPRIGAWYGGVLKIEGFHSSDGAHGSNAVDFAQFNFGTDHFQMNAATSNFDGNVGIKTPPASGVELHVNGEVRVDSTSGVATRQIRSSYFSSTSDITVMSGSAGDVVLKNGNTTALTLNSSQNAIFVGDLLPTNTGASDLGTDAKRFGSLFTNGAFIGTLTSTNIQLQGNLKILNKGQTSYIDFAARNVSGSEVVMDLTNVGSATLSGDLSASEILFTTLNGHAHIDSQSSSLMIEASNIQAMGNLIPDGNGSRPLGATNRYWSHLYANGITTKAINITQTADVGELTTANLESGAAVGLSLTYPTSNVAAGDGLAMSIGIAGRGRSYIANKNTSNNLDASNLEFYTEGGGVINKVLTLGTEKEATFTGEIYTPDGSASAPSYSFSGRTDTGMYARAHSSADRLSFTTDGSERFYIDSNGATSAGNSYVGENNSFRNYAGDWGGTTGTANKGFYFLNTASGNTTKAMELTHDGNATFAGNIDAGAAGKLSFTGTSGNPDLIIKNNSATSSTSGTATLQFKQALNSTGGKIVSGRDANYSSGATRDSHLKFYTSKDATDTLALTLDASQDATFAGNVSLDDGKLLKFGAADDYQIYHNSTTNVNHIFSNLDRQLSINAGIIQLTNQANNTTYLKLESTGATFAGNVTLNSRLTFDYGGDHYIEGGTNNWSFKTSSGTVQSTFDFSDLSTTFSGDVTVAGDLIVRGTTTTLNTATVEVKDNILQLNTTQGTDGNVDTATAATSGISIYRGVDGDGNAVTQASLIFDDADDTWDLTNNLKVEGTLSVGGGDTSTAQMALKGQQSLLSFERGTSGDAQFFMSSDSARLYFSHTDIQSANLILTLNENKTATFGGDIILPAAKALYLDGGGGTYIYQSSDGVIDFYGDTVQLLTLKQNGTQNEVVVNEGSGDIDFRVEANTNANAFFVEAEGSGAVAIGHNDPQEVLHVKKTGTARIEIEGTDGPTAFKTTNDSGSYGWYIPGADNSYRLWNFGTSADLVTVLPTGETHIGGVVDGSFTALRLMNQKTYGSGTGTNEKVRFVMGIAENGIAYSGREGFVIDVGVIDQSDSSNIKVDFQVRDGGTIGTYQTVNGHDKSVEFVGTTTFKHGGTTNKTVFGSGNEINTFTAAGGSATMYLNWQSGNTNIGKSALVVENQGDSTFKGSIHPHADSTYNIGTDATRFAKIYADTLYGDGSNLTNVAAAAHNHNDIYYTETEIDANHYGKTATDAKFTSSDGSGDEWKFTLGDESNLTGNKWYKVAQVNQGSGGLHIKGSLSNHVEAFGTQKVDLLIQGREGGANEPIEITGTVDVLNNATGTSTDKVGIRVIEGDNTTSAHYHYYDVYIRTTRYSQAKFHLTKFGTTGFYTSKPSVTSEPAPATGGNVELDTSGLTEGNYIVKDSSVKTILYDNYDSTATFIKDVVAQDHGFHAGIGGDSDGFVFHDLYTSGGNYWGYKAFTNNSNSRLSLVTDGLERLSINGNGLATFTDDVVLGDNKKLHGGRVHPRSVYSTSNTNGFLIATDIASNAYAMIQGEIDLIQFNSSTKQRIEFSATLNNNGEVFNSRGTADIDITIKLFVYNSKWYLHIPQASTYMTCTAYISKANAYVGDDDANNSITNLTSAAVPSSGVSGSKDIVCKFSQGDVTFVGDVTMSSDSPILYLANTTSTTGKTWRFSSAANGNFYLAHDGVIDALSIEHTSGKVHFGGDAQFGTSKSIYLNGSTDGLRLLHDGSNGLIINQSTGDLKISNSATDKDIIFRGKDDASMIDALTLDMSDGGWATFNSGITVASTFSPSVFGGDVSILGDLNITGDINSTSVTNLDVDDLTITVAKGAADSAAADGAGIVVDGAGASLLYDHTGTQWEVNKPFEVKVGSSAITMTEYSDGAVIWLDGSDGDFAGSDYYNIAAYGGGQGSKLSFGYGAAEKMYMDRAGSLLTHGTIDVQGTGQSQIAGNLYVKGGGYNQIKIANNLTADTNKQSGIVTENYEGNNVSILQTFQQNNSNAIYYGSADASFAGIQSHYFYVNADSDTAGSGHTKAFQIKSDLASTFYGNVSMPTGNTTGKFAVMSTGVHSSYDFYNNGTSYFNGAVTIDDNLTMPTNSHIEMGGNWKIQGTDGTYFQRIKTVDSSASDPVDTFSFDVKLGSSASWKSLLVLDQHDAARFSGKVSGGSFLVNRTTTAGVGASLGDINGAELGPGYLSLSRDDTASAKQILFEKNDVEHSYIKTASNKLILGSDTTTTSVALQLYHSANPVSLGIDYSGGAALAFIESVHDSYDVNTHILFKPGGAETWRIGSHGSNASNKFVIEPTAAGSDFIVADNNSDRILTIDTSTKSATIEGVAKIKGGLTTDGYAKFYNWRALQNTSNSSNLYYRIARITGSQSTRFIIELAGRSTSYGDTSLPAYGKLVGQLNNDNNYDLTYYNHSTSNSEVVTHIGQVDVSATETDIYIKVGQFAEITAIAHISDGSITTYDSDSGSTTKPTGYTDPTLAKVWNTLNDGPGSGLDADTLDGISGEDFLRSDINDTATGSYTFTGSLDFALDSNFANSMVRFPETTNQNPTMMFHRPTGSADTTYPWRFQAGGGGSSTGFYIGTGSAANVGSESITNKLGLSSIGTLTVSGDVIAYGSPSDAKYKENVKPIENALDKVMDLEGVSFDWKEGDDILDIKEDIGFIAQDVQKVIPELVRENEDGNLSLRYQGIIPVLLEAMKEQQKQIDELKSQMAACNQRACDCKK